MIFQEPMTSFSPVHTIGNQICEAIILHQKSSKREATQLAIEMLGKVGIPDPHVRIDLYPHQLSGGMRQRAMIAMALSCNPSLLIADEPTTALDVTIQAQILELMQSLQEHYGMSIMLITHDLAVIAEMADDVIVMYMGQGVEYSNVDRIFYQPKHPYTVALQKSIPKLGRKTRERLYSIEGTVPDPFDPISGCPFHPRCQEAIIDRCTIGRPPALVEVEPGHRVACYLYHDVEG